MRNRWKLQFFLHKKPLDGLTCFYIVDRPIFQLFNILFNGGHWVQCLKTCFLQNEDDIQHILWQKFYIFQDHKKCQWKELKCILCKKFEGNEVILLSLWMTPWFLDFCSGMQEWTTRVQLKNYKTFRFIRFFRKP